MTILRLDTEKQEISLELALHGEQRPIQVTIHYKVRSPNHIEITSVRSSRDWIATLVNEVLSVEQRQLEVPPAVITALSKLIR